MAITVSIFINSKPIITRSAVNITPGNPIDPEYEIDDGRIIKHTRADGAIVLAKKMLDGIVEPGLKRTVKK